MPDSTDFDLNQYQWTNRILLVFAPSASHPAYEQQMQLFEGESDGFEERDLVLITVLEDGTSRAGERRLSTEDETRLHERFDIEPDQFRVVLIGKDGTEKRRDDAPTRTTAIFDTIDAMPMRQREMREDGDG